MKLVTIIGSGTNYGRTAQNSILTEVLVFHQTLSTPKATTTSGIRRTHPEGEPKRSTFSQGSNNENELQHKYISYIRVS